MRHGTCKLCDKSASYGYDTDRLRLYCVKHKKDSMLNLTKRVCKYCARTASFGFSNGPSCVSCSVHKEKDMIHTSKRKHLLFQLES